MLTTDAFLEIIDAAKGRTPDSELSRNAGLAPRAVRGIREGKKPSLDRAAALADALGLEIAVRVKGELVDPLALAMGFVSMLGLEPTEEDDEVLMMFVEGFAAAYDYWAKFFAEGKFENRREAYRAARAAVGALRDKSPAFAARRDGVIEWMRIVAETQGNHEETAPGHQEADDRERENNDG